MSSPQAVRQAALEAYDAGLCVVPPREDGTKAPVSVWKEFQTERPTRDRIENYYAKDRHGIGLLGGPVSGHLEVIDIENPDVYGQALRATEKEGLADLIEHIEEGYLERCPRGGVHWMWRTDVAGRNTKLALSADRETLIERKGDGGFIITAPSHGPVHPSGKAYERMLGTFSSIRHIELQERDQILECLRSLDQSPRLESKPDVRFFSHPSDGTRPGDDFNSRGDWHQVLTTAGWSLVGEIKDQQYWRRPDKDQGHSAVLHTDSGIFVPFSTSTPFPEVEEGYTLFRAYTILHHGGDWQAAAAQLRREGYGKDKTIWTPPPIGQRVSAEKVYDLEIDAIDTLPVLGRPGWILEKGFNLIYSFPKVGKTELVRHLTQEWAMTGRTVLYLTEDPLWMWKVRTNLYPKANWKGVDFVDATGWTVEQVFKEIEDGDSFDVLVLDTIRNTLGYEESRATEDVARLLIPLIAMSRRMGFTVVATYHAKKTRDEGGRDISGHHALFGVIDRAIRLAEGDTPSTRVMKVMGRMIGDVPTTMHYRMTPDHLFHALDVEHIAEAQTGCRTCGNPLAGKQQMFCSDACRKKWTRDH
jgi:hypothetical protein